VDSNTNDHSDEVVEAVIVILYGQGYVDASARVFVITDKGLQYLNDLDSDWPHHSLVPRRPLPTAGGGEVAIALPEPPTDNAETTDDWYEQ